MGGDVVAEKARDRDGGEVGDPDRVGEVAIVGDDLLEAVLAVVDEVHLVNGEHDVPDAEQMGEEAMPAGLGQHALARVDEDDGELGGRGAGDHVARVLLVAGGIGDDELALLGAEEAVGDVDGDALLALGGQAIDQQREVDRFALGADALGVGLQRLQVVLEDHVRVIEHPPDQGGLAVIDRPAGDEAQHRLVLVRVEVGVDVLGDQGFDLVDRLVGRRHQK